MNNVILVQQDGRRPLRILVDESLEMGRECDGLLLVDERVSRRHLEIRNEQGRLVVTDLGSSNGTFLDGDRIESPVALLASSQIQLGSTIVTLEPVRNASVGRETTVIPSPRDTMVGVPGTVVRPAVRPGNEEIRRTSIENVAMHLGNSDSLAIQQAVGVDDTVTIMFSDIESSTEKALSMGDVQWMEVLGEHNTIFERQVQRHGGKIIKNQGDGYMVTFGSARRALLCAAAVQADLRRSVSTDPNRGVRVRIGCHTGEAIHDASGDLFGRHVIIAARVANLAEGAQVLVSSIVREITAARGDLNFGEPQPVQLKGVVGTQHVYDFDWASVPV
jgi:class 3 adenylate cyclase